MKKVNWLILGGSFNNNMEKKRGKGFIRKSTLGHVTKGRYHVKGRVVVKIA
jgi:hypothetical protein